MADIYQNRLNKYLGDGARSAKFEVLIIPPEGVTLKQYSTSEASNALSYQCYSTNFPGMTAESIDFKYLGRNIPVPNVLIPNQSWSATFYNDENHSIRKFFKDWMESYQTNHYSSGTTQRLQNLTLSIYQWDYELKNKTIACILYGIFPVSMGDIEVSFESLSQIQTFQVEFKYAYFDYVDIAAGLSAEGIKDAIKNTVNNAVNSVLKAGQTLAATAADKAMGLLNDKLKDVKSLYKNAGDSIYNRFTGWNVK